MPTNRGVTSTILRMAERQQGVSQPEVTSRLGSEHVRSVQRTLFELTRAGRLHKAGPHMRSRWFVHAEHAARYARETSTSVVSMRVPRTLTAAQRESMHKIMTQAPRHVKKAEDGPMVITERTKVTIAPTPRARYQVDEAPRVVDAAHCRPWAENATRGAR